MQTFNRVGQTLYVYGVVCGTGEEDLVCGLAWVTRAEQGSPGLLQTLCHTYTHTASIPN